MLYLKLKHCRKYVGKYSTRGRVESKAERCIYLETPPECYIIRTDKLRQCIKLRFELRFGFLTIKLRT